jgi:hypothetical protein
MQQFELFQHQQLQNLIQLSLAGFNSGNLMQQNQLLGQLGGLQSNLMELRNQQQPKEEVIGKRGINQYVLSP